MRILHILDHSIPLESGYAMRTQAILIEQRALGWETFHLTGPKQGLTTENEEIVDGWEFNRAPPPGGLLDGVPVLGEFELMGEITYRIEKIVKRVRPHVLHAHSPALNAIPALRVGRRTGTPVVYEVRAFWEDAAAALGKYRQGGMRYRLSRSLENWALRRADAVVTASEGLHGDIVRRGIAAQKLTVIPNGVDTEAFEEGGRPETELKRQLGLEGAQVLGFIGGFFAYEGLAVLLRALPEILPHAPQLRLLLVGDGPEERQLKQIAGELGVADKIAYATNVPYAHMPRYYNLIDVFVSPRLSMRYTELVTPPNALEAMARGCLLAASDVGGHRELIRHDETGVIFRAGAPHALAAAVVQVVSSPDTRRRLQAAARSLVESQRTWAASVARYESIYSDVTKLSWRP